MGILTRIGSEAERKATDDAFAAANHFTLGRVWLVEEDIRDSDDRMRGTIGSPAGAGQVACWGFRLGPVVPGACTFNSPP